jgi:hypothetical protein
MRSYGNKYLWEIAVVFVTVMSFCSAPTLAITWTWTTIDCPDIKHTVIYGISGSNLIGSGGIYNLDTQTWTTLKYPGATSTDLYDIDGDNIVGMYYEKNTSGYHGFVYNLDTQTWTTLDFPGASWTTIYGIDGSTIVGSYTPREEHGFLYNGADWITIDFPGAITTMIRGIEGNNLVGAYSTGSGWRGFMYDGINWTELIPGAGFNIYDIDGNYIVGYADNHGIIYDLDSQTWRTIDFPGASYTEIYGIDGDNIVGRYYVLSDTGLKGHGFIATIPEPITIALFALGALMLRRVRRH